MINSIQLNTISQIVKSMEESFEKLEKAYRHKNTEEFEALKKSILQLQEKLSGELK